MAIKTERNPEIKEMIKLTGLNKVSREYLFI